MLLCPGDVLTPMHECRELGVVVLVGDESVGLEHGFEPLAGVAGWLRCKDYIQAREFFECMQLGGDPEQTPDKLRLPLCIIPC